LQWAESHRQLQVAVALATLAPTWAGDRALRLFPNRRPQAPHNANVAAKSGPRGGRKGPVGESYQGGAGCQTAATTAANVGLPVVWPQHFLP